MNQTEPKFIGKRISVVKNREELTITITQQVERWQEAMLIGWLAAWTFCGAILLYYTFAAEQSSLRFLCALFSAGWMYFFVRITKIFFWRKSGKEIITFRGGKLYLRNAIGKRGRVEEFAYFNIFKLGMVTKDPTSFLAFLDDSFWIIGGDRVGFNYNGSKIRLGKQLSMKDAELLIRVMESAMKEYK